MKQSRLLTKEQQYAQPGLLVHETSIPEQQAVLAFNLLERWGMVAAMPDGEDGAGRQKLKLSTPDELVDRAFDVAALAFKRANELGLIHYTDPMPAPADDE